jgi:hypothetical protein
MRRGERADAMAGGARDGVDERHRRALAVGAADGDDMARRALHAELRRHGRHAIEPERDFLRMHALLMLEPLLQVHAQA